MDSTDVLVAVLLASEPLALIAFAVRKRTIQRLLGSTVHLMNLTLVP
jgi:hypothetical protein